MKILVTGAGGFLGHHLLKELRAVNPKTFILSPRSAQLDLLDRDSTCDYVGARAPDVILHMAALCGGILANQNSPADFLHANVDMATNIFYAAKESGCKSVYSLGSVCAYPKFCPVPFKEDNLWDGYPEETNAPYGMAKRLLMMLGQTYRQQYGFTGAHFIPVNMYGEHDHFDLVNSHVIPALLNKFVTGVKNNSAYVECWGTGEATREFLYAGACVHAIVQAVTTGFDCAEPINLGTGQDISIRDLAYLIKDITGFTGEIVFNGTVSDGQPKRMLDVSRAQKYLSWNATTTLREGIKKTYEWYKATR